MRSAWNELHSAAQARIVDVSLSLGIFFGTLWVDKILETGDTPLVVKTRAAQVKRALVTPSQAATPHSFFHVPNPQVAVVLVGMPSF